MIKTLFGEIMGKIDELNASGKYNISLFYVGSVNNVDILYQKGKWEKDKKLYYIADGATVTVENLKTALEKLKELEDEQ